MKGRKPLPTEIKANQGTLQKCRTNFFEPKVDGRLVNDCFEPPEYLSDRAKRHWEFVIKHEGIAWIKTCDRALFEQYCTLWDDIRACDEILKVKGPFLFDSSGNVESENPAAKLKAKLVPVFRSIAAELGLTPSSRSRVIAIGAEKNKEDTFSMDMFSEDELRKCAGEEELLN